MMNTGNRTRLIVALAVGWCAMFNGKPLQAQGLPPEETVKQMQVADGFHVDVVASEPLVLQPVCIEFDDRGRLWVIQYLQYPNPEGLKRVQVDRYSRTKYDRVPEPPPYGPRGADRITILSDTNGDGRMDQGRDFIDGLNLATGMAFGHEGVYVLNVPYLLFYPDRNRDDVPDSDPEVLLTGFGMEDAHSVANSLTWGPDGWLYGCQGSTVTARIRGIEFQQGVWRYHPQSDRFELFCEGGGNAWGLDFDSQGNLFYSTNYGGHVLVHGLQGAYFVKSFAKHGDLHNPHSYGYFDHAAHKNFRGGHVTVGGIVYQGDSFPDTFRGKYIAGDLLGHGVYWHDVERQGSTVATAHGGELLVSKDDWFAPTDVTLGPDGAVYVSDWYDGRTAHPDPDADWDRTNGRIYRIAAEGTKAAESFDFSKFDTNRLLELHHHSSQWYVRHARQELVRRSLLNTTERNSLIAAIEPQLRKSALNSPQESVALEALWTLLSFDRVDEALATPLLNSPHPAVRSWMLRLLGDRGPVSPEMAHRLDEFAEHEPVVEVRQQLACTAARLPAHQALPMINANINRDLDNDDNRLPLLWWWAVERHSVDGRDEVLRRFLRPSLWKSKLGRETLLPRLIRRYAAEANQAGLEAVVQLLKAAPNDAARSTLWIPVLQGLQKRPKSAAANDAVDSQELSQIVLAAWQAQPADSTLLKLGVAMKLNAPLDAARRAAFDPMTDAAQRITLLDVLAPGGDPTLIEPSLELVLSNEPETIRSAALRVLSRFDDPRITSSLIGLHQSSTSADFPSQIRDVLLGRRESARVWLTAVDRGEIAASVTPLEQIRKVALFDDTELNTLVTKHWGRLESGTREEKLAEVRRLNNDVRASEGNLEQGQAVFKKHCATCHQLFGEGTKLGPDLTSANRRDRDFLLVSLVDPSSVIRKEYVSVVVVTKDGRIITGLPTAQNEAGVTLVNAKNEPIVIPNAEIDELHESPVSIMPADLYRQLKPQELRDLFAWLQRSER
jgi:putative membrane-bound dehydrogenase-like protein